MEISVKNRQFFPTPVYLTPPLKGFPLEYGIGTMDQKAPIMGLTDGKKSFKTGLVF